MKVYEVTFDHQIEPSNYGLFESLEKAEAFLKSMNVKIESRRSYYKDTTFCYDGGYRIEVRNLR